MKGLEASGLDVPLDWGLAEVWTAVHMQVQCVVAVGMVSAVFGWTGVFTQGSVGFVLVTRQVACVAGAGAAVVVVVRVREVARVQRFTRGEEGKREELVVVARRVEVRRHGWLGVRLEEPFGVEVDGVAERANRGLDASIKTSVDIGSARRYELGETWE